MASCETEKNPPNLKPLKKKNQKKSQLFFWPPLALNSTSGGGGLPWAGRGTQEQQSRELRGEAAGRVAGAAAEANSTESQRVWSPPSEPRAESRQVQKSLQDFLFHTNSRISAWNSKAGRGSSPCPSPAPYIPEGAQHEPTAPLQRQEAPLKGAIRCFWVPALPLAQPFSSQPLLVG